MASSFLGSVDFIHTARDPEWYPLMWESKLLCLNSPLSFLSDFMTKSLVIILCCGGYLWWILGGGLKKNVWRRKNENINMLPQLGKALNRTILQNDYENYNHIDDFCERIPCKYHVQLYNYPAWTLRSLRLLLAYDAITEDFLAHRTGPLMKTGVTQKQKFA